MATSGTYDQTRFDAARLIDHAVRRCGVLTSVLTGEQLRSARDNLFLILTNLANTGLSLFCVQQLNYAVPAGQKIIELAPGTIDVLNALFRQEGSTRAGTADGTDTYTVDMGEAVAVQSVAASIAPAGSYTLSLEASDDGVAWAAVGTVAQPLAPTSSAAFWAVVDAEARRAARYWRVVGVGTPGPLVMDAATFFWDYTEVPMAKLNRDSYLTLPQKDFASSQPLQYWYDKQVYQPRAWLWPTTERELTLVSFWVQRQIQDVGDLSNELQVPSRWFDAIIFLLAQKVVLEIPPNLVPQGRVELLKTMGDEAFRVAEDGERDGAPIRVTPNIGYYTR